MVVVQLNCSPQFNSKVKRASEFLASGMNIILTVVPWQKYTDNEN